MDPDAIPEGTVTVLFTDLVDSTRLNQQLGDDRARALSRSIEEMAKGLVEAHKGILIKEMGDGLMAVFQSARRAIAASREIQAEMRRRHRDGLDDGVAMRIGLHTGEVITEDGDVHGETVIIAKRIEGLAPPGGVLASETVHGVLGTARDELIDQGARALKGIDAEWHLYLVPPLELDDAVVGDHELTAFISRTAERAHLGAMVRAAAAGTGGMVLISGQAGIGKSRLVRECLDDAARLGMLALVGHCIDMASPPPYQPHIDQLEQAARGTTPELLRAALGENAPEVAKLMPSLRQRFDDIPPPPDLPPEQERRYMLHGVCEFMERAARNRPIVLVFEDLHWADESTLLLLRQFGSRLAQVPLLVIGTFRPDDFKGNRPFTTALGPLTRDVGAEEIRLQRFTREEVAALVAARAGKQPPGELVDLIFEETQGNPFFVEELYRHLHDAGRLFDRDGGWRSGFEIGETEVPQGIRLVLERRLDQLAPEHRKTLGAAAVIGRVFSFDLLAACTGADEDDLFDMIESGERLQLIEEQASQRDAQYVFMQEQIRQTLVGELSLPRRQRLHIRIADALQASDRDGSVIRVAHHLYQAGQAAPVERTVAALLAAAAVAIEALAFEDSMGHLALAEPLVKAERRPELRAAQAMALRGAGRVDDALRALDGELASPPDGIDRTPLRLQRIQLLLDQYRAAAALDDVTALLAEVDAGQHPDLELDVRLANGRTHYILSLDDPEHAWPARVAYEQAYAAAAARGDKRVMVRALLPTTWFTDYWHDYGPTATANVQEALELAQQIGDVDLHLDARAAMMHRAGAVESPELAVELLADLEARHDPVRLNAHLFWMMWQYLAAGRFGDCVDACSRGIALAELLGTAPVQYGSIKALALADAGRFDEVFGALAEEVTDDDHPFGQAMASFGRSCFLTRVGAWQLAAESLVDTLERAKALSRVWMQLWAASLLAIVAARLRVDHGADTSTLDALAASLGDWNRGLTGAEIALVEGRYSDALELASKELGAAISREHVVALDVVARAQLALGDYAGAVDMARRGVAAAEQTGFDSIGWRIRHVLALALDAQGEHDVAEIESATASAALREVAGRIADADLRDSFLGLAVAPNSC